MRLHWKKCRNDVWCKLNSVNLDHFYFDNDIRGVYIIWHGGPNATVVYIGQGNIKDRISAHRRNKSIQQYAHLGLYVTWAIVDDDHLDGVEGYLAASWGPIVGVDHPTRARITVNSPWE